MCVRNGGDIIFAPPPREGLVLVAIQNANPLARLGSHFSSAHRHTEHRKCEEKIHLKSEI